MRSILKTRHLMFAATVMVLLAALVTGCAKQDLYEAIEAEIGPKRDAYLEIRADEPRLDAILSDGAAEARTIAHTTIQRVRDAVGIG